MEIIFTHPTGNQNSRAVAEEFCRAGLLKEFHTTIASFPSTLLDKLSTIPALSEIRRRSYKPELKKHTFSHAIKETARLFSLKAGLGLLTRHEAGIFSVDAVYRDLDLRLARRIRQGSSKTTAVYAYEDGAAYTFAAAKEKGIYCFYDLPIGYWRTAQKLLNIEKEKFPDWASTLTSFKDSEQKLARKDEEIKLADCIFVASRFTAHTLKLFPGVLPPVITIPYGFPKAIVEREYTYSGQRPLKALFVGGLSQRKGLTYLFEAVDALHPHVALTIVGRPPVTDCLPLNTALRKHTWIPALPHDKVLELMRQQDVLVFPSLFEGFGLVITEAMAQGTPVITTERTAGPDLIDNGNNGWLVEAGSTEKLVNALSAILSDPRLITQAGKAAKEAAKLRTWKIYGEELTTTLIKYISTHNKNLKN